ncbi:hypothetical protein ACQY0O_007642 [Thecaphora frezii]
MRLPIPLVRSLHSNARSSLLTSSIAHLNTLGYDPDTVWEQRVSWGHHDQFSHVNNVHYLRWIESARMVFFESLLDPNSTSAQRREEVIRGTGKSVILAGVELRYRRPVTYPDTVLIAQAVELPIAEDRVKLLAVAYSLQQQTIVARATQDCVSYDYRTLKKCPFPDDLRIALEAKRLCPKQP